MSVVVRKGSKVAARDTGKAMPAQESATARITGMIADVEVKHATRVEARDEFSERWLQAQELSRKELEAKNRRRQRAVYD